MIAIPLKRLVLYSPKPPEACALLLQHAIPPKESRSRKLKQNTLEYYGSVWQDGFTIETNINYWCIWGPIEMMHVLFNPIFSGSLSPQSDGTRIRIYATYYPLSIAFSLLYYTFFLIPYALGGSILLPIIFISILLFWQVYIITTETRRLENFLYRTLNTRKEA
jgi:hypothetical protein